MNGGLIWKYGNCVKIFGIVPLLRHRTYVIINDLKQKKFTWKFYPNYFLSKMYVTFFHVTLYAKSNHPKINNYATYSTSLYLQSNLAIEIKHKVASE